MQKKQILNSMPVLNTGALLYPLQYQTSYEETQK
jgi:hypothetical protein